MFLTVYKGSLYIKAPDPFSIIFVENIFLISCWLLVFWCLDAFNLLFFIYNVNLLYNL